MPYLLSGIRAGVLSALVLTLWSVLAMPTGKQGLSMGLFTATAFGFLAAPQMVLGAVLGSLVGLVNLACRRFAGRSIGEALRVQAIDRLVAALALTVLLGAGLVALGVGGLHLAVTSKFVRAKFQAMGLGLGAAGIFVAVAVVAPALVAGLDRALAAVRRAISAPSELPVLTLILGLVLALAGLGGLAWGYGYAESLEVWTPQFLNMALGFLLIAPVLFAAMLARPMEQAAWRWGVPLAGLLLGAAGFAMAPGWAVGDPTMREAVLRDSPLIAAIAKPLVTAPASENVAAFAFAADCDEAAGTDCKPSAPTVSLDSLDHPARRAVWRALEASQSAVERQQVEVPKAPRNVVFILIDTLRHDHMGYAGYPRATTPNIDRIAEDAAVFLDLYATSPHTPRSIPPLLFGRYSSRLLWAGAQYNYPRVLPENTGLFEVLAERGWKNQAYSSHFYFEEKRGLAQGFAQWDNQGAGTIAESNDDIAAPRIWSKVEPAIARLGAEQREKGTEAAPFSLVIHMFEPHARWIGHDAHNFGKGETTRERHINNYDSEIAFVDTYVGRIVEKLKAEGLYDNTILVLTSDHGEAFEDHGMFFHGQNLYNEVIRVPAIIRIPGWGARRIEGPVSSVDIAPTLLDALSLPIPPEYDGVSHVDSLLGRGTPPVRPVFAELLPYTNWKEHHRAIIWGKEKFIANFTLGIEEYYDLAQDPREQNNLARSQPEKAARLKAKLMEFVERK